jgi:hypothetical protein
MKLVWHRLLPYLPFLIIAMAGIVAIYHARVYW